MKNLLAIFTIAVLLYSCTNNDKLEPIEEPKISLDSIAMSFELDGKLIEMSSPETRYSGWGKSLSPVYQGENIAIIRFRTTYRNDDYKVEITLSEIINGNQTNVDFQDYNFFDLPLDIYKKEVYTNNQLQIQYTDYSSDIYDQLQLEHFYGFHIKIHDKNNDTYYESKVRKDKITQDSNSDFSPTKHLEGSYVTIVKSELIDVIDIEEGISHAHGSYLTEVAFQTNLIKYTKDILNEIDYKGSVTLTDGKIIGLF